MMEFAICQWQPDLSPEAIESLRTEGVTAIEPGPSFLLDRDAATLKADAGRLRAAGITVYSCHAPFGDDSDLSLPAEDARRAAVRRHVRTLQQAALAGAQCLVIHPSGPVEPK